MEKLFNEKIRTIIFIAIFFTSIAEDLLNWIPTINLICILVFLTLWAVIECMFMIGMIGETFKEIAQELRSQRAEESR